jgi:large subunit ribosomal protein L19e
MNLKNQRRMAAELLGCGVNRVWIDPNRLEDVADAITRNDVRVMINAGAIKASQKKGISSGRRKYLAGQKKKGRQRGPGSRKGAKGARTPRKRQWIRRIRPLRARLKELREQGVLDSSTYRKYYRQAKGGMFKSTAHLDTQLKLHGHLTDDAPTAKEVKDARKTEEKAKKAVQKKPPVKKEQPKPSDEEPSSDMGPKDESSDSMDKDEKPASDSLDGKTGTIPESNDKQAPSSKEVN